MNKQRRKEIERAIDLLGQAQEIINAIEQEETEAIDNLPENLMYSQKADEMQEKCDSLQSAESEIETLMDDLRTI